MIILRGLRDHAERMVGRTYRRIRSDPYPCTQSHCVIVLAVSGQFPMAASGQIPVAVNSYRAEPVRVARQLTAIVGCWQVTDVRLAPHVSLGESLCVPCLTGADVSAQRSPSGQGPEVTMR